MEVMVSLPLEAQARKNIPLFTGLMEYFPDALVEVAAISKAGSEQHHPGQPLHWDKSKSTDHLDCMLRHALDHGKLDTDGKRHMGKAAWRALAELQMEIEREQQNQNT